MKRWRSAQALVTAAVASCVAHGGEVESGATAAVHLGPITGSATLQGRRYTCSRAGVFVDVGGDDGVLRAVWQPPFRVVDLAAVPSGPWLLAGGGEPARRGVLAVLTADGDELARTELGHDLLYAVAAAPDGSMAAAGGAGGEVWLLPLPSLSPPRLRHAHGKPCRAVAFSPDGAHVASGGRDGLLLVSPVRGDAPPLAIRDHVAGIEEVAFTAAGTIVSRALDGRWREHDRSGRQLRSWSDEDRR